MTHPAMDTDALRRVAEAHHVAGAAMYRLADAIKEMGDVTQPAVPELPAVPAVEREPEPEPGEWRNDRAPWGRDVSYGQRVWIWNSGAPELVSRDLASFWHKSCPARNYWAPGSHPAPTSPPPSVLASSVLTPEQVTSMKRIEANGGWTTDRLPTEEEANFEEDVKVPNSLGIPYHYEWAKYYTIQPGAPWCSPDDTPAPWDPACLDRNGWIRSSLPTVEDAGYYNHVLIPVGNGGTTSSIAYHLIVPGQPWAPWGSNPGRFEK